MFFVFTFFSIARAGTELPNVRMWGIAEILLCAIIFSWSRLGPFSPPPAPRPPSCLPPYPSSQWAPSSIARQSVAITTGSGSG